MKTGVQTPVFAVKTDKSKEAVGSHSCEIKTGHLLKQIPCFWSERRDSNRDRAALRAAADGLFDGIEEAVGSHSCEIKTGHLLKQIPCFWSERRDSNPRPLGPESP